jgi:hypothetical protein
MLGKLEQDIESTDTKKVLINNEDSNKMEPILEK